MPKYRATVTSRVPKIYTGEVEVEAPDKSEAISKIEEMYDGDEIELTHDVDDYDRGELTIDMIEEIK